MGLSGKKQNPRSDAGVRQVTCASHRLTWSAPWRACWELSPAFGCFLAPLTLAPFFSASTLPPEPGPGWAPCSACWSSLRPGDLPAASVPWLSLSPWRRGFRPSTRRPGSAASTGIGARLRIGRERADGQSRSGQHQCPGEDESTPSHGSCAPERFLRAALGERRREPEVPLRPIARVVGRSASSDCSSARGCSPSRTKACSAASARADRSRGAGEPAGAGWVVRRAAASFARPSQFILCRPTRWKSQSAANQPCS